jgi:hypothetical protein
METIQLGCATYSQSQAIAIMRHSAGNDKTYSLAQQLVAAKLNVICGHTDSSCVSNDITAADNWLCAHPVGSGVTGGSAAWQQIKSTYSALGKYNTGKSCAPVCRSNQ